MRRWRSFRAEPKPIPNMRRTKKNKKGTADAYDDGLQDAIMGKARALREIPDDPGENDRAENGGKHIGSLCQACAKRQGRALDEVIGILRLAAGLLQAFEFDSALAQATYAGVSIRISPGAAASCRGREQQFQAHSLIFTPSARERAQPANLAVDLFGGLGPIDATFALVDFFSVGNTLGWLRHWS